MVKPIHVFTLLILVTLVTSPLATSLLKLPHLNKPRVGEGPYLPIINSILHPNYTKCRFGDLACYMRNFLLWLISSSIAVLKSSGSLIGDFLFKPLVNATLKVVISVPVFVPIISNETLKQLSPYVLYSLGPAMSVVYGVVYWVSYIVAGIALFVSALALMFEGSVVRYGEAVASLKRCALVLILLPLLNYIYNYSVLGIACLNRVILTPGVAESFIKTAAGIATELLGISFVLLGIVVLVPVVLVIFIMLVLGALRLLLTAVLACVLPLAVALTLIPLRPIREVGMHLVTMLVNLLFSTTLAAVMLRLCAEVAANLEVIAKHSVIDAVLGIIMVTASLCAPVISLMMAPRAGIVMFAMSYFFGYVAQPTMRALAQPLRTLRAGAIRAAEYVTGVPVVGRVVRYGVSLGRVVTRGVPHYLISRGGGREVKD